jgi:hypothetical protein
MKILAKDDCFSYYLSLALARAGQPCTMACYDEKVPSFIITDALRGIRADPAVVEPWLANPYCYKRQKALKCLDVTDADLIVIGSFADLTIKGYKHRKESWRFFEIRHCIQDTAAVDAACDRMDLLPITEILENNLVLFDHFKAKNPQAKAMWVNYPYLDGASTEWDDQKNPIPNRVIKSRWHELTTATTKVFPEHEIFVLNIPEDKVRWRGDDLLWHYHDSTYDWAAGTVLEWFNPNPSLSPSIQE